MEIALLLAFSLVQQLDMGRGLGLSLAETEEDRQLAKVLGEVDQALAAGKSEDVAAGIARVKAMGGRRGLEHLIKCSDPVKRALGAFGFRMLPVKRGWSDLQLLLVDPKPFVRRQVILYAAAEPAGLDLSDVQTALGDSAPEVRTAAIGAVIKIAKKPGQAERLLRDRLAVEKDAQVTQALRIGLTALGVPSH